MCIRSQVFYNFIITYLRKIQAGRETHLFQLESGRSHLKNLKEIHRYSSGV